MLHQLIDTAKRIARPITRQRFRIEQWKYRGDTILDPDAGNALLHDRLLAGTPTAAGKMGSVELGGLRTWLAKGGPDRRTVSGWGSHRTVLHRNAGVYPDDDASLSKWATEFAASLGEIDALGVWFHRGEHRLVKRFAPRAALLSLNALEPYYQTPPWSRALAGKRVTAVTPFASTFQRQYLRRTETWRDRPDVLPVFELSTVRCPLSAGLTDPEFPTWFDALDAMTDQIAKLNPDVVLVGAGAWSIPLVARAKRMGKFAIHLGGSTQILFGVRGGRWDNHPRIGPMMNDAWARPGEEEKPKTFRAVENGCYW